MDRVISWVFLCYLGLGDFSDFQCLTAQLLFFKSSLLVRLSEGGMYVPMSQLSPNNLIFC